MFSVLSKVEFRARKRAKKSFSNVPDFFAILLYQRIKEEEEEIGSKDWVRLKLKASFPSSLLLLLQKKEVKKWPA